MFEGKKILYRTSNKPRRRAASEGGPVDRDPPQPSPARPADDGDGGQSVVTPDWADDEDWARICDQIAARDDGPSDGEEFDADPEDWYPESVAEVTAEAEADGVEEAAVMDRMVAAGLGGGGAPPPRRPPAPRHQGRPGRRVRPGRAVG